MTTPVLSPHFTVHFLKNDPQELFMSFALLNRIASIVGSAQNLQQVMLDISLSSEILKEVLMPRDGRGQPLGAFDLWDDKYAMTPETGEAILAWVLEHLTDFFTKRLQKILTAQEKMIPKATS